MRMRSISALIVFAAIGMLAVFSADLYGQAVGASRGLPSSGSYTVTGKVFLPDGKPAVGARVDVSCDFTSTTTNTDSDGTYRVTGIPAGNCSIVARVSGFDPQSENRQIQRDTPYGQAIYIPLFIRATAYTSLNPLFKDVPKPAVENYRNAVEKLEKGDPDAALLLLDKAIAAAPSFAAAWYQKGLVLVNKKDNAKAVEAFVKAIELKPDYIEAKYGFGTAQLELKNYEVSEAVFRDVLKQKSDMPEAHLKLGISLYHLKKADEAESELKGVVATKGGEKLALAHLYLGQIYVQKKRNAEAAGELQKYLDLVPKAPNAERIRTVIGDLKKQS
jgi:cytochrome c-type biogenesis protein CcmH/NrfG